MSDLVDVYIADNYTETVFINIKNLPKEIILSVDFDDIEDLYYYIYILKPTSYNTGTTMHMYSVNLAKDIKWIYILHITELDIENVIINIEFVEYQYDCIIVNDKNYICTLPYEISNEIINKLLELRNTIEDIEIS